MRKIIFVYLALLICSCASTKLQYISCTDVSCPYCSGTGNQGRCTNCDARGFVDSFDGEDGQETCSDCNGSGEKMCGYYVEKIKVSN